MKSNPNLCELKQNEIKKFDEKKFRNLNEEGKYSYFLEDSSKVKMIESNAAFSESIELKNSRTRESRQYFKDSKKIEYVGQFFYDAPIGCHTRFDKDGTVLSSVDHDAEYSFSIDSLCSLVLREFEVDLLTTKLPVIVRKVNNGAPSYQVLIPLGPTMRGGYRVIIIDGTTGKITTNRLNDEKEE